MPQLKPPRKRRLLLWGGGIVLAMVAAAAFNTTRNAARVAFVVETPEERAAGLAIAWRFVEGEGPPPRPGAVLMSGCDGVHDNMDLWAGVLAERGRTGLVLDSHTHRQLDRAQAWRLICSAQILTGPERAGDLAIALAALGKQPGVEGPAVVLGASHGGWAALEFVGLATRGTVPPGLTAWPAHPDELLAGVGAVIALYPYCGVLDRADEAPWQETPPVLMILSGEDQIVSTPACIEMAERLRAGGASVEVAILPGVGHGFDQRERSVLSPLEFDAAATARAEQEITRFLDAHGL